MTKEARDLGVVLVTSRPRGSEWRAASASASSRRASYTVRCRVTDGLGQKAVILPTLAAITGAFERRRHPHRPRGQAVGPSTVRGILERSRA